MIIIIIIFINSFKSDHYRNIFYLTNTRGDLSQRPFYDKGVW